MEDPSKVIIAVTAVTAIAYSIKAVASATIQYRLNELKAGNLAPASDDRLARIEQAVDAIALEVERISEGQRFTTKLLSDRKEKPHAP